MIIVCAAHPDDEVLGAGATIAKLAKEEEVVSIIFSYGQNWPFWKDKEEVVRTRRKEANKAARALGIKEEHFLGLRDGKIEEDFTPDVMKRLRDIFEEKRPDKVFYHSSFDGHRDHLAVNSIMDRFLRMIKYEGEVYKFEINLWNWFNLKPFRIFDVSETFEQKLKALDAFSSQWVWVAPLRYIMTIKAMYYGKKIGVKYGESFYLT